MLVYFFHNMAMFSSDFDNFVTNSVKLNPAARTGPGTSPKFPDLPFRFVPRMDIVPKSFIFDDWLPIP